MLVVVVGGLRDGGRLLPAVPADTETWLSIAFLALPATAVAMVALSWAQARVNASKAAIILALEPAAAAATAVVLGAELGPRTIIGGALLISAMVLVELGGRRAGIVAGPAVGRPQLVAVGRELPAT
jgi:drug/metabolite transporter (DMT)-like permease